MSDALDLLMRLVSALNIANDALGRASDQFDGDECDRTSWTYVSRQVAVATEHLGHSLQLIVDLGAALQDVVRALTGACLAGVVGQPA